MTCARTTIEVRPVEAPPPDMGLKLVAIGVGAVVVGGLIGYIVLRREEAG